MFSNDNGLHPTTDLQTVSISDALYSRLQDAITAGRLMPGSLLKEAELTKTFGVSRTPLREALQRLTAEGYLERRVTGPLRVAATSSAEAGRLVDVREVLESLVARRLAEMVKAETLGANDFAQIRGIQHEIDRLADGSSRELIKLGYEFHLQLAALTQNATLQRFLKQVIGSLGRYRYLLWGFPERRLSTVDSHWSILTHILAGDAPAAEDAMRHHIVSAREAYIQLVRDVERLPSTVSD